MSTAAQGKSAPPPRLIAVSDRRIMGPDPVGAVLACGAAGLPAFQWREKDLSVAESFTVLSQLRSRVLDRQCALEGGPPNLHPEGRAVGSLQVLVNDRADLAQALGLGLHLSEASLPTPIVRRLLGPHVLLGRSVHSMESAQRAALEGVDYVTFGPIFDTPSKRAYGAPQGLQALRDVCASVKTPVLAIGGIDSARAGECMAAGAWGVCVIRALWEAPSPPSVAEELLRAVVEHAAS